jgi:hypothetical protein
MVIYECKKCAYCTYDKSKYERHCKSLKHLGIERKCKHVFILGTMKGLLCNKPCRGEYCKIHNESRKRSYEKRKSKITASQKAWVQNNKERVHNNKIKYYRENKETILKKQKLYHEKNKDKLNEKNREYYKRKRETEFEFVINEKIRSLKKIDILRKREYQEEHYISLEWAMKNLDDQEFKCIYCNAYLEMCGFEMYSPEQVSIDRINNSKAHLKDNCVICCLKCNLQRMNETLQNDSESL